MLFLDWVSLPSLLSYLSNGLGDGKPVTHPSLVLLRLSSKQTFAKFSHNPVLLLMVQDYSYHPSSLQPIPSGLTTLIEKSAKMSRRSNLHSRICKNGKTVCVSEKDIWEKSQTKMGCGGFTIVTISIGGSPSFSRSQSVFFPPFS